MRVATRADLLALPAFLEAWNEKKRAENRWAGLSFFQRDTGGGLILASRHWPHNLCWLWSLRVSRWQGEFKRAWRWEPRAYHPSYGFALWFVRAWYSKDNAGFKVIFDLWPLSILFSNQREYAQTPSSRHEEEAIRYVSAMASTGMPPRDGGA